MSWKEWLLLTVIGEDEFGTIEKLPEDFDLRIEKSLSCLTSLEEQVVLLRFREAEGPSEIAADLHLTEYRVRKILKRALEKLRQAKRSSADIEINLVPMSRRLYGRLCLEYGSDRIDKTAGLGIVGGDRYVGNVSLKTIYNRGVKRAVAMEHVGKKTLKELVEVLRTYGLIHEGDEWDVYDRRYLEKISV
ncbi:MAG: sigma factor-like helix-turn-helix DNA-binding protein [Candidatus Saccharibacteria bacterium]|nr:sigma factor-like helix-turn-helix DNA-binding protein [Candidatus Saccharibacteria bacterium]